MAHRIRLRHVALLTCLFVFTALGASAQEVGDRVRAEMRDGSRFVGQLTASSEGSVTIRLASGESLTLDRADVLRLRVYEEVDGRFTTEDPNRTRLFFAPTARALGQGEGYFVSYYVFLPFVAYGVTDRITLAGGVSLIPGVGLTDQLVYVAPKATLYQKNNRSVGVGALYGTIPGEGGGGLAYASTTLGPSSKALTLGAGFAFTSEGERSSPLLVFGGELQLSNSLKLISENYFTTASLGYDGDDEFCDTFPEDNFCDEPSLTDRLLLSGGVRFFGERLAGDLAFVVFPALIEEADSFIYIPWLSFAYNFGN